MFCIGLLILLSPRPARQHAAARRERGQHCGGRRRVSTPCHACQRTLADAARRTRRTDCEAGDGARRPKEPGRGIYVLQRRVRRSTSWRSGSAPLGHAHSGASPPRQPRKSARRALAAARLLAQADASSLRRLHTRAAHAGGREEEEEGSTVAHLWGPQMYVYCKMRASLPAKVRVDLLRVHHGLQHGQRKRQDGVEHKRRHPLGAAFAASRLRGGRLHVSGQAPQARRLRRASEYRTCGSALRRKRTVLCRDLEENLMG